MEPRGQEYTLEKTSQRTTSVIIRKAPDNCTLMQRTAMGLSVVELAEDAVATLLSVMMPPTIIRDLTEAEMQNLRMALAADHSQNAVIITNPNDLPVEFASMKRRGRPPKSVGEKHE